MDLTALLQTLGLTLQCFALVLTLIGLGLIFYQVRQGRKAAVTSAFTSAVSDHWRSIEERRMLLRTGEMKVLYPSSMIPYLNKELDGVFGGDISALARAYLDHRRFYLAELGTMNKDQVYEAIRQEYAYQDLIFNLYEEEWLAAQHLHLVDDKLWQYWKSYIDFGFQSRARRRYWSLRQEVGYTFPAFAAYINNTYCRPGAPEGNAELV